MQTTQITCLHRMWPIRKTEHIAWDIRELHYNLDDQSNRPWVVWREWNVRKEWYFQTSGKWKQLNKYIKINILLKKIIEMILFTFQGFSILCFIWVAEFRPTLELWMGIRSSTTSIELTIFIHWWFKIWGMLVLKFLNQKSWRNWTSLVSIVRR